MMMTRGTRGKRIRDCPRGSVLYRLIEDLMRKLCVYKGDQVYMRTVEFKESE